MEIKEIKSIRPSKFDEDFQKFNEFLDLINNAMTDIEKKMLDDMYAAVPKVPHTNPLLFADNYNVDFTDSKNRKIRSRKILNKGDLIVSVKPLASSLTQQNYYKRCHYCFKKCSAPLKECSMCHFAIYCSTECQKEHWTEHRLMCGIIKKSSSFINPRSIPSLVYIVSTLYWKLHNIDHPKFNTAFKNEVNQTSQMISLPSQLPAETREKYIELSYLLTKFNQLTISEGNMLEFFELLCRIHSSLFSVCNEEYEYFATALYYPSVFFFR